MSQSGFLWWPNIPRCINRIRIVQFIRFAPDLGRICTGPPHIHNLQAIHFSLPSAFSAFSIPKPGSEGCWAAEQKIANYPCVCICSILGTHPPCPPFHSQFSVEEIVSLSKKVRIVVSFTRWVVAVYLSRAGNEFFAKFEVSQSHTKKTFVTATQFYVYIPRLT